MKRIDLDDLPPRVARTLTSLADGEELLLAQNGAVVARLLVAQPAPAAPDETLLDLAPEERVKEVLEQFSAMINDEF